MKQRKRVLLAGATGYLGKCLIAEIQKTDCELVALARDASRLPSGSYETVCAEVTKSETLRGIMKGVDVVISSVGITRQKDGLTYMDVDFQANMNLLSEAKKAGVRRFIYVSVLHGEQFRELKICEAKERFVDALKVSGLDYCVIRPNGYFSDMKDFLEMARGGRVYLFGSGEKRMNPISGEDLAKACVGVIEDITQELEIGGPVIYTQNEIGRLALSALSKKSRIVHLPDWIRRLIIGLVRTFTSSKTYGPIEFFLTLMAVDMIAPAYGEKTLDQFFKASAIDK